MGAMSTRSRNGSTAPLSALSDKTASAASRANVKAAAAASNASNALTKSRPSGEKRKAGAVATGTTTTVKAVPALAVAAVAAVENKENSAQPIAAGSDTARNKFGFKTPVDTTVPAQKKRKTSDEGLPSTAGGGGASANLLSSPPASMLVPPIPLEMPSPVSSLILKSKVSELRDQIMSRDGLSASISDALNRKTKAKQFDYKVCGTWLSPTPATPAHPHLPLNPQLCLLFSVNSKKLRNRQILSLH